MNRSLLALAVATIALCAAATAEARPDHPAMMLMSGEMPQDVEGHNDTADDAATTSNATSAEDSDDDDDDDMDDESGDEDDDEDDEIHVEGKTSLCPARQPEIVEIEKYCLAEYKMMKKKVNCTSTAMPPTTEMSATQKPEMESASLKMEMTTTERPARKPRTKSCHYYQCILKKLQVLDEAGIPKQELLETWAMSNITDVTQKEKTQERIRECVNKLKSDLDDAKNGTGSSEETEHTMDEEHTKVHEERRCETSKKLMCCLRHTECPVLKFP